MRGGRSSGECDSDEPGSYLLFIESSKTGAGREGKYPKQKGFNINKSYLLTERHMSFTTEQLAMNIGI